jgi:hypothetical protein
MPSAFILRVPFVTRAPSQRRPLVMVLAGMLVALLALLVPAARADTVPVKSAELRIEEGEVLLNAEFDLNFNPTLEEALQRGHPALYRSRIRADAQPLVLAGRKGGANHTDLALSSTR